MNNEAIRIKVEIIISPEARSSPRDYVESLLENEVDEHEIVSYEIIDETKGTLTFTPDK